MKSLFVLSKARRLDRVNPGWADCVNIDRFNLRSPTNCVLGQVYGHYRNSPPRVARSILTKFFIAVAFQPDLLFAAHKERTWIACIETRQTKTADTRMQARARERARKQGYVYVPKEWSREPSEVGRQEVPEQTAGR